MQRKTIIIAAITVMLSSIPFAAGEWMVAGSAEPNTPFDTSDFMWDGPAPQGAKRVYFNVITFGSDPVPVVNLGVTYNPNVAAAHTQIEPATAEYHEAVLGVWTDCNGDGYIGLAESAMREYPSEILDAAGLQRCPPRNGALGSLTAFATAGYPPNYNSWVTELVPISRNADQEANSGVDPRGRDARLIRDEDAKVWGDFERPGEHQYSRRCPTYPFPRGTFATTGGLLTYADCRAEVLEAANLALDPVGMGFSNPEDAYSGPVGLIQLGGSEHSDHAAVRLQDCSAAPIVDGDTIADAAPPQVVALFNDGDGNNVLRDIKIVRAPPSNPVNGQDPTQWTVPGQANETLDSFETEGSCDTMSEDDPGQDVYGQVESDNPTIDPNNKKGANWNFHFIVANRGGAPVSLVPGRGGGPAGIPEGDLGQGWGGSRWQSDSVWGSKPGFRTVKTDLEAEPPQAGLPDAYWLTFYAKVGGATISIAQVPGGGGQYGSESCQSFTTGIHNGWNCDDSTWYKNPDGSEHDGFGELDRQAFAYLGEPYQLRDVDCYDGSNDAGQPIQPAGLGSNPCP